MSSLNSAMMKKKKSKKIDLFIEPHVDDHYDWFAPNKASGFTQPGL